MTDHKGFLTDTDKEFLRGEKEYTGENANQIRYQRRSAIRERTRAALADFAFLCDELDANEREKIFIDDWRTSEALDFEQELSKAIQFFYIGVGGRTGFSRPLKRGVANGEARMGRWSALDVVVRFAIEPVWNADIHTVTDLVEADEWDRLDLSDLPQFINMAKRADAIDFDEIRAKLAEDDWFQKYRLGKKHKVIPGGYSTPLMDPEVFDREGIGDMTPEELRDLFGEGYPDTFAAAIYDGEKVFRPPPIGEPDGDIEVLEWINDPDVNEE
jgi:hypothetical protein